MAPSTFDQNLRDFKTIYASFGLQAPPVTRARGVYYDFVGQKRFLPGSVYTDKHQKPRARDTSDRAWLLLEAQVAAIAKTIYEPTSRQALESARRTLSKTVAQSRLAKIEAVPRLLAQMQVYSKKAVLGQFFSFVDRYEILPPASLAIIRSMPPLLDLQEAFIRDEPLFDATVKFAELTIRQAVAACPYRRMSMLVTLNSLYAVGASAIVTDPLGDASVVYAWSDDPFAREYDRARRLKGMVAIKEYSEIIRSPLPRFEDDDNATTPSSVVGRFEVKSVAATSKARNPAGNELRVIIDRDDPTDASIQLLIDRATELLGQASAVTGHYNSNRWVGLSSIGIGTYPVTSARMQGGSRAELPAMIANKKCVINPEDSYGECFKWASLAAIARAQGLAHPERLSVLSNNASVLNAINWNGIEFPFNTSDILKLEAQNPGYTWAVYTAEHDAIERDEAITAGEHDFEGEDEPTEELTITPIHNTTPEKYNSRTLIEILLYEDHFMCITDLDRLHSKRGQHCAHCPICTKRFVGDKYGARCSAHTKSCKATWKHLYQPLDMAGLDALAGTPQELAGVDEKGNPREHQTHIEYTRSPAELWKPIIITADFEAANTPLPDSKIEQQAASVRCKFNFMEGCDVPDELREDFTSTSADAAVNLLAYLLDNVEPIRSVCSKYKDDYCMVTDEDRANYNCATVCHFCKKGKFTPPGMLKKLEGQKRGKKGDDTVAKGAAKVLDHCHATGAYRGAAHMDCNIQFSTRSLIKTIPVFFHNVNYDIQFIFKALADPNIQRRIKGDKAKGIRPIEVKAIALNGEKFKALSIGPYQFLDSMSFIASSLESAIDNLKDSEKIALRAAAYKRADALGMDYDTMFEAYKSKQIFPYEGDWHKRLDEPITAKLEWFQSKLNNAYGRTTEEMNERMNAVRELLEFGSGEKDSERRERLAIYLPISQLEVKALKKQEDGTGTPVPSLQTTLDLFMQQTGARTWRDMHDIYLTIDTAALSDCMLAFRKKSFETLHLDPAFFISNSAFAWNAMLKMTGAKLELIPTSEQYRHFEKGIRGGLSMTANRVFECNNPNLEAYDETKATHNAMYLDANALYGGVMQGPLPDGRFHTIDAATFDLNNPRYGGLPTLPGQPEEEWLTEWGAYIECDIHFPPEVHDKLSDYVPLPETVTVPEHLLSEDQRDKRAHSGPKLVAHLLDRKNYRTNITALKMAVALGAVVKKYHSIVEFHQSSWMRPWIEFCTARRKEADAGGDTAGSDYWKLMGNACFGKTMESVMHHTTATIASNARHFKRLLSTPRMRSFQPIAPELAMVISAKNRYMLNKPVYVGQAILDHSKVWMQHFFYHCLKKHFPGSASKLIQHDTDSFIIGIATAPGAAGQVEFEDKIMEIRDTWLDMSKYKEGHKFASQANRKRPGFFKDELGSNPIVSIVGVGAKQYDVRTRFPAKDMRKGKGCPGKVVKNSLTSEDYKRVSTTVNAEQHATFHTLRTVKHRHYFQRQTRRVMSWMDDKMYFVDIYNSRALGHWRNTEELKDLDLSTTWPVPQEYEHDDDDTMLDGLVLNNIAELIGYPVDEARSRSTEENEIVGTIRGGGLYFKLTRNELRISSADTLKPTCDIVREIDIQAWFDGPGWVADEVE